MKSMAVTFSCPSHVSLYKSTPLVKPVNKVLMLKHSWIPRRPPSLQIRSCFNNKVFEDQSQGIICYKDENGEIVCEGYDEGPRCHQHSTRTAYHPKDSEILDLLHRSYLEMINGGGVNSADKGVVALQEDFKWNGFNRFY